MKFLKNIFIFSFYYLKNPKIFSNFFFEIINKIKSIYYKKPNLDKNKVNKFLSKKKYYTDEKYFIEKVLKIKFYNYYKSKYYKLIPKKIRLNEKYAGAASLNILYSIANLKNLKNFLETGVAHGWSTQVLLSSIHKKKIGKLISTDKPYMTKKIDVKNVIRLYLKKNWKFYGIPDRLILKKIFLKYNKFDLCHYDSDKSYFGRMFSYKIIWKHLSHKGILISDDINDNFAFLDFAKFLKKKYYIFKYKTKYIGIIVK